MTATADRSAENNGNQVDIGYIIKTVVDIFVFNLKVFYEYIMALKRLFSGVELKDISSDTVLITGTGHGIGKELATQYAAQGCKIVCVDVNAETNAKTADELNGRRKGTAFAFTCDITNSDAVEKLIADVTKTVGPVTVLVNNAGIMPTRPLLQQSNEEIRRTFDINVLSHLWLIKAVVPGMIKQRRGHIVSISSMAGIIGLENLVPYCATKFGVRGMMEALSEELRLGGHSGIIKLTAMYPYMVDTGLCKKPRFRFSSIMGMITPTEAAESIVLAHRQELQEASIPRYMLCLNNVLRNSPIQAQRLLKDFMDSGVDAD